MFEETYFPPKNSVEILICVNGHEFAGTYDDSCSECGSSDTQLCQSAYA